MKFNHIIFICVCMAGLTGCSKFDSGKEELNTHNELSSQDTEHDIALADSVSIQDIALDDSVIIQNENCVTIDIADYYTTNIGDPSNLYYIDANNVLWGCGRNNYGQLGITPDYSFYENMQKIAENVIHVDFSQTGYMIYLTADHKLYGLGNAGCGALQQFDEFDYWKYTNGESYTVSTPCLLMENVVYARCGRSDIACIKDDSSIWIFGTIGYDRGHICFFPYPVKVLENASFVTGGLYNHAALLADGSVWTWGYNYTGNCGLAGNSIISKPIKVADNVVMVWTGNMNININCNDISDFDGIYEKQLENTIILTNEGDYLICGANVGSEEKTIPVYYETSNYSLICTYEFLPYTRENFHSDNFDQINELMLSYKVLIP